MVKPLEWLGDRIRILDQTRLPAEEVYLELRDYLQVIDAIKRLSVRGAPLIGVAAAYGFALGALNAGAGSLKEFLSKLELIERGLASSRPTAVNLFWALERMRKTAASSKDIGEIRSALVAEAKRIDRENEEANERLSTHGAGLIGEGSTVMTHCNAGSLATAGYGTALGIIKKASEQGKQIRVYATETRPLLQGARLTTWELLKAGIPVTLITDSMAGYFMNKGEIDSVVVGADRIASNGDAANKIGTYTLAILAAENAVPFYVAAPASTIDLSIPSGDAIPIEERDPSEVTRIGGSRVAPEGVQVANPAFDVTPHCYVTALVTEFGLIREPYSENIEKLVRSSLERRPGNA